MILPVDELSFSPRLKRLDCISVRQYHWCMAYSLVGGV